MVPPVPASGVCAPWTTSGLILARPHCSAIDAGIATIAALDASNLLYALTRRKYSGLCTGYVRPMARPHSFEERFWALNYAFGYNSSWGICNSGHLYGFSSQCFMPPEIDLGVYPLTSITAVKIDGVTIPSNEYRIDNNKILTRVLLTADTQPTQRYGWPTCQRYDLPDTEPGTFSVAYTFGMAPPSDGVGAATALAAQLAISRTGGKSALPERITSITRQQISMAMVDPMSYLDKGLTGIWETDLFIRKENPEGTGRRPAGVWSPDLGSNRRPT